MNYNKNFEPIHKIFKIGYKRIYYVYVNREKYVYNLSIEQNQN